MAIANSTLYAEYAKPSPADDDTAVVEAITGKCDESKSYGWRQVRVALQQQSMVVNHKKVRRLMREHDLSPGSAAASRRRPTATATSRSSPIWPKH